jgi:7tm Chemosensory receptor
MDRVASSVAFVQTNSIDQQTPEMRKALQSFYMQIVHQPVRFSAFCCFNLNTELLTSITTGILSYLMILIQVYASNQKN